MIGKRLEAIACVIINIAQRESIVFSALPLYKEPTPKVVLYSNICHVLAFFL